ncbi:hypothetical protein ACG7TL_000942 [Trametes sanguinea]
MPELPEVERAAKLLREVATGKAIIDVEAVEDTIVFSGISHTEFVAELKGRTVTDAQRYGGVVVCNVLNITWLIFILHLKGDSDEEETQVAFLDARRLGRVRLCKTPLTEPPISALGFDPILSMPDPDDFKKAVRKRSCPIKALLLDQSFSAGVGNWVADEILYHARVHPEERCNVLTDEQVDALYTQISTVCRTAVSVNADDSKFPDDWLFKHRWGKGKKEKHTLKLPDGKPATIKWITVGGRTSAYVAELQKLKRGATTQAVRLLALVVQEHVMKDHVHFQVEAEKDDSESDLTPLSGDDDEKVQKVTRRLKRKLKTDEDPSSGTTRPRTRRQRTS